MDVNQFTNAIPQEWYGFANRRGITAEQLSEIFFKSKLVKYPFVVGTRIAYEASVENWQATLGAIKVRIEAASCPNPDALLAHLVIEFNHSDDTERHLEWCVPCAMEASQIAPPFTLAKYATSWR